MSDVLTVSSGAVTVYQRMLGTVSNNIANVGNPDYVRQDSKVGETPPTFDGRTYLGSGAVFNGVKRQYDSFIESSLRNANSDLVAQQSLVNYASRVVDILGSGEVGLSPALDRFFASARALSADPAASITRISFLRDADGVSARFRDLASQMGQIDQESRQAMLSDLGKVNTLAGQIAQINTQLDKTASLDKQPAALLDQRDALLRDLSKLIDLKMIEADNGSVSVVVGGAGGSGLLVADQKTTQLDVQFNDAEPDSTKLVLDPYGSAQLISGTPGGSLGGLRAFRTQMLEPAFSQLDYLAKTFMNEVNQRHRMGVDAQGESGKNLFGLQPDFTVEQDTNSGNVQAAPQLVDTKAFDGKDIKLSFDAKAGQVNTVALLGPFKAGDKIEVSLNGQSKTMVLNQDTADVAEVARTLNTLIDSGFGAALRSKVDDRGQLVVNSTVLPTYQFKVSVSSSGSARAQVDQSAGLWTYTDPETKQRVSGSNSLTIKGVQIALTGNPRDGQNLIIHSDSRPAAAMRLLVQDPSRVAAAAGFRANVDAANLGGAKASVSELDGAFSTLLSDRVLGSGSALSNNPIASAAINWNATRQDPVAVVAAGQKDVAIYLDPLQSDAQLQVYTRDGTQLIGSAPNDGNAFIQNTNIAQGFNRGSSYSSLYLNQSGAAGYRGMNVFYGAQSQARSVPVLGTDHVPIRTRTIDPSLSGIKTPKLGAALTLEDGALTLNGVALNGFKGLASVQAIADRINSIVNPTDNSGAPLPQDPALVGIVASVSGLPQPDGTVAQVLTLTRDQNQVPANDPHSGALELGFGTYTDPSDPSKNLTGKPADLAQLGLRTAAYIKGSVPEDLLVFATGTNNQNNAPVKIAAEFTGTGFTPEERREALRASPFVITFLDNNRYQITDKNNKEWILADRRVDGFTANTPIDYGGLRIKLSRAPSIGDSFIVDGNRDGLGDNQTAVKLAELEKQPLAGDGNSLTISDAYLNTVDKLSNITQQAQISSKAMEVVQKQAQDARESVSGVSMDEEAANLIRFQQAYQAAAKAMQVATEMFDAIVKI